jgi:hypothetical protein
MQVDPSLSRRPNEMDRKPSANVNISNCPSCDSEHNNQPVYEYAAASGPFSHWYTCPKSGDPVSMLLKIGADDIVHVPDDLLGELLSAAESNSYVAAIFTKGKPDDSGRPMINCFAHIHYMEAFDCPPALQHNFEQKFGPPPATILKEADPPKPLFNLFADDAD